MDNDNRNLAKTCNLTIEYFALEAKSRWLRPSEISEILQNHEKFHLHVDTPHKPPGGSWFLFNRGQNRYFRKDGHCWRKKKDGKTVREAHENLKVGDETVLHCYYAHGEDNKDFQRRTYWLLDKRLQKIVLVHYRDLSEKSKISSDTDPTTVSQGADPPRAASSTSTHSSNFAIQESNPVHDSLLNGSNLSHYADLASTSSEMLRTDQGIDGMHDRIASEEINCPGNLTNIITDSHLNLDVEVNFPGNLTNIITDSHLNGDVEVRFDPLGEYSVFPSEHSSSITGGGEAQFQENRECVSCMHGFPGVKNMVDVSSHAHHTFNDDHHFYGEPQFNNYSVSQANSLGCEQHGEMYELDSYGNWKGKETGQDFDNSLMTYAGSCNDTDTEGLPEFLYFDTDPACSFAVEYPEVNWAANYDREKAVVEPAVIEYPTAADSEWVGGNKGIDLTNHISKLAYGEFGMGADFANFAAADTSQSLQWQINGPVEGDEGYRPASSQSLSSVRNRSSIESESWRSGETFRFSDEDLVVSSINNHDHRQNIFNGRRPVSDENQQLYYEHQRYTHLLKVHDQFVEKKQRKKYQANRPAGLAIPEPQSFSSAEDTK
ncbi:uncharacterized protein A4U43_C05F2270 [Asparagus officinalis]|uniref:CG-1 domain-containing protein n=1 Tax=Asparagus officinalis TaxID=4686 RepID=A0A5P1ESG4_ASPOF|nr:uncharacterized protein LOC109843881 [Asparagus officinalis]ONK67649.1 uncharacterized protein A4U43_C05F2270 [Asparagus officinalis]